MRPALLKHGFHEHVKSGLHITQLPLGAVFDWTHYQDGHWQKSRWERSEQQRRKQITDNQTGETKLIFEWVPTFFHRNQRLLEPDEIEIINQCLRSMDEQIDNILNSLYEDVFEGAMLFEAAYRRHKLTEYRTDIDLFKSQLYQTIGDDLNLGSVLYTAITCCMTIRNKWHSQTNKGIRAS